MSIYPGGIPSIPTDGSWSHDQVANEIEAIATELGVSPSGVFATVAARLTASRLLLPPPNVNDFWVPGKGRTGNGTMGVTAGTEYGIGWTPPPMTVDQVVHIGVTAQAGATFRVGVRPYEWGSGWGAPIIDAEIDASTSGRKTINLASPVVLEPRLYALTWVRIGGTAGISMAVSEVNPAEYPKDLWGIAWGEPATGHGPMHGILNTGITGALPTTVSATAGRNTVNAEGGYVPLVMFRRSA